MSNSLSRSDEVKICKKPKLLKLKLDELVLDEDIYPRKDVSRRTVEGYVEALRAKARFPPVVFQELETDEKKKEHAIIDGYHRALAYVEYNSAKDVKTLIKTIEAEPLRPGSISKSENLEWLRIEAARRNLKHGKRLSESDITFQAERIVKARPIDKLTGIESELAKKFIVPLNRMSEMIGPLVRRRKTSRNALIFKLNLLGWIQTEIAGATGLNQVRISQIIKKFDTEEIYTSFKKGKTIEEIAEYYGMDEPTVWAIVLRGKSDLERFKLFGTPESKENRRVSKPKVYNLWNFNARDPRLGITCPGNIPGQVALNLLYYYTKQGDLVLDPMAGGGSTIDACLVMGRRCRAYDRDSRRSDILKRDLVSNGLPDDVSGANLVFLDPPYWSQNRGKYTDSPTDFSNMPLDRFYSEFQTIFNSLYSKLPRGGHVALIIGPTQQNLRIYDHAFVLYKQLLDAKFEFVNRVIVPYSTEQVRGCTVSDAEKGHFMLKLYRDLLVFRRE